VHIRGRTLPNYATIDCDARIPFWRRLGEKIHEYDCAYILQLSHGGRQRDIPGVENERNRGLSSTNKADPLHGFLARAMTRDEIQQVTRYFADGARRAREANLDGVELHACNGYLITQFLSSGINDRHDEYGGSLENRARFLLDIIKAIRQEVGSDFHLQVKISAVDHNNAVAFWEKKRNPLEATKQICRWIEELGVDALHISTGSSFPHPLNPPGGFPLEDAAQVYDTVLSSGIHTFRLYLLLRYKILHPIFNFLWNRTKSDVIEGINVHEAREIKRQVNIPVLCTVGFRPPHIFEGS
jgi:2,4-dienoyl-CoA reductase-like NADH-dependent reductase (Old Yellow Enzyme family)